MPPPKVVLLPLLIVTYKNHVRRGLSAECSYPFHFAAFLTPVADYDSNCYVAGLPPAKYEFVAEVNRRVGLSLHSTPSGVDTRRQYLSVFRLAGTR